MFINIFNFLINIENNIEDAFNFCCRKNLSLNEKYPDSRYENQLGQKTVFLTVRMFDLWETAIIEIFTKHFKNNQNIVIKPVNDTKGDIAIILSNTEEIRWEVKSSQAKDSFTGATHSASKCNNYILINYSLNKNLKLKNGKNQGFITEIAIFLWENMDTKWQGKPTKNNSFTSLKIPKEIITEKPQIIVIGTLEPKKKMV